MLNTRMHGGAQMEFEQTDDLQPEYDFRSLRGAVRGKYAACYHERWHRYHELVAQRDNESLVADGPEHVELIGMFDTLEEWNARRIGLPFELARLRKIVPLL